LPFFKWRIFCHLLFFLDRIDLREYDEGQKDGILKKGDKNGRYFNFAGAGQISQNIQGYDLPEGAKGFDSGCEVRKGMEVSEGCNR
jgi:hypothetical protein